MSGSTSGSYDTFKFEKEYDTRYEYKRRLPVGGYDTVRTHDETKYDGEFAEIVISIDGQTSYKPHNIFVTDGELNRANIFPSYSLNVQTTAFASLIPLVISLVYFNVSSSISFLVPYIILRIV
jgi:hypothetical protein